MLAPNPEQDEAIEWFVQNPPCDCYVFHDGEDRTTRVKKFGECSPCEHAKEAGIAHFHFRDSQLKFDVNEEQKLRCKLEIVKYAAPSPVNLNRQLINIIAQVCDSIFLSILTITYLGFSKPISYVT